MKKRVTMISSIIILMVSFSILNSSFQYVSSDGDEVFFTLVAKVPDGVDNFIDTMMLAKTQFAKIGINVEVIPIWGGNYLFELIAFRNFDLFCLGFTGGGIDPDFTGIYNENGSLNLFGYHTSMDYNETLGTGVNEWYMKEGLQITPPYSEERIQHYWAWEQYLMDEICPMKPMFSKLDFEAIWQNLQRYNLSEGLLQSWGKMNWEGMHVGQLDTTEIVIADYPWSDLSPVFQDDASSIFISQTLMDSLIWFDANQKPWPHLAKNFTYLDNNRIRVVLRENIKWQEPPTGNWDPEYLDAEDVYFTFFIMKYFANKPYLYDYLTKMEIIDKYTIDFYFDGDLDTIEAEPFARSLQTLSSMILPEHFLNQTQLADGITPDINHESWSNFGINAFGTGLFKLDNFSEGIETKLKVFDDCWWLNKSITNDPALNWETRFGNFNGGITKLRVKILKNQAEALGKFESGLIDIIDLDDFDFKRDDYKQNGNFNVFNETAFTMSFIGYNMQENRPHIGSREPCPLNETMTKGLAIRKAMNYAINREEIKNVVYGGERSITYWPIYKKMNNWCNPNIIKYEYNIQKAREYMELAGFVYNTSTVITITQRVNINHGLIVGLVANIIIITIYTINKKEERKKLGRYFISFIFSFSKQIFFKFIIF
ncbi:MAG: hypothetical protein GF308_10905 [Candidatus Heimdallarchaeota archaeon]|nr:hypothetical protein [Candidatus Heimdallarchaeota archaeon]